MDELHAHVGEMSARRDQFEEQEAMFQRECEFHVVEACKVYVAAQKGCLSSKEAAKRMKEIRQRNQQCLREFNRFIERTLL